MEIPLAAQQLAPDVLHRFKELLDNMVFQMEQRMPDLPRQCTRANEMLRQYPEISYLLTEEEIGKLSRVVISESKIQFTMAASAGRGKNKDPLKGVNLDSLDNSDIQI